MINLRNKKGHLNFNKFEAEVQNSHWNRIRTIFQENNSNDFSSKEAVIICHMYVFCVSTPHPNPYLSSTFGRFANFSWILINYTIESSSIIWIINLFYNCQLINNFNEWFIKIWISQYQIDNNGFEISNGFENFKSPLWFWKI